jgi:glycosyltransferase involved in cell wall biosynthesis
MEDLLRVAFLVENNLGHRTHLRCLKQWVGEAQGISPTWVPIEPWEPDIWSRVPVVRDQTPLCWSGRAAGKLQSMLRSGPRPDLFYLHTVSIALAARMVVDGTPTVVSLDTTPEPSQTFAAYRHGAPGARGIKLRLRESLYRSCFGHAAGLIGLSPWVSESLVRHYGVSPAKVATLPTGVDLAFWSAERMQARAPDRPRLVFVGGDFVRKGGEQLLRVWQAGLQDDCDLVIVSGSAPSGLEGVRGLSVLPSASPEELRRLFSTSTAMVLPSRAEGVPWVIMEAMAAGLPVVSTPIGGIPWMIEHGVNGLLVPDDDRALHDALRSLLDPDRARRLGAAAARHAPAAFDGATNYGNLAQHLRRMAMQRRQAA